MNNHIRTTVSFNRRKQDAGEKFDNFVTDLRILVKDCGYVEENRMLRDAIVLRSSHAAVREKYLEKGDDLTLDMAIGIGQNYETSKESMRAIGIDEDPTVHAVNTAKSNALRRSYNKPKSRFKQHGFKKKASDTKWMKCGYDRNHARWVRVYTVFSFFVFKFANEKRITNSFFVFRFQICERKTNSFFVFRFQK